MVSIRDLQLSDDQAHAAVRSLLDKLLARMEKDGNLHFSKEDIAHLRQPEIFNKLVTEVTLSLRNSGDTLTLRALQSPEFFKKFLLTCMTALLLEKNFRLGLDAGLDRLKKLEEKAKDNLGKTPKLKLDGKKILAILGLTEKELIALQASMKKTQEELNKLAHIPKLSGAKSKSAGSNKEPDIMITSLYGLISPQQGSNPITVTVDIGNFFGVLDVNPNHGFAPIDAINRPDSFFPDYLGLVAETRFNYYSEGANNDIFDLAQDIVNAVPQSPTLRPPGH